MEINKKYIILFLLGICAFGIWIVFFSSRTHRCDEKAIKRIKEINLEGIVLSKSIYCAKSRFTLTIKSKDNDTVSINVGYGFACLYDHAEKGDFISKKKGSNSFQLYKNNKSIPVQYRMDCNHDCICKHDPFE